MKKEITLIATLILLFAASVLATDPVTPYLGLTLPSANEANWNVPLIANFRAIDAAIETLAGSGGGTGQAGPAGPTGPAGTQGPAGAQGPVGPAGGVVWGGAWGSGTAYTQGEGVTSGGLLYVAIASSTNVQPPNASYWILMTGATGPAGPAGAQGAVGPQGFQGIQGVAGAIGPQGITGATGATGAAGAAGATGAQGAAGIAGYVVQTSCSSFTTTGQLCYQTSNSTMWAYTGSALYQVDDTETVANGKFLYTNTSTGKPEAGTAAEMEALIGSDYSTPAAALTAAKGITRTVCSTDTAPSTGRSFPIWRAPAAATITGTHYLEIGATSLVGQIVVCDGNAANCVKTQTGDVTATAGTNANGTVTAGTVAVNSYVVMYETTLNGSTPTSYTACIDYTVN